MNRRTFKFGVLAFAASMSLVFGSCNKETSLDTPALGQTPEQRIAELNTLTQYQGPAETSDRENHFWAGLATADFGGACGGAKLGAEYGEADPPMAIALGIVGGAAVGSGYYYWQNGYVVNPIDTIPSDLNDATASFAKTYTDTIEQIGYEHNHYILSMFKKGTVMASTIKGMNKQWGPVLSQEMSSDLGMSPTFYLSIWNDPEYKSKLCKPLPNRYSVAVDSLSSYAPDPQEVHPWVDSLYTHIYQLSGPQLHYASDYAEAYSEMVKEDATLKPEDAAFLLDGFSVVRYSAALWSANLQ